MMKKIIVLALLYLMATISFAKSTDRWFNNEQVNQGAVLFKQNCSACHGQNAEATADWKTTDAKGNYPPPPLNGTAHAWHHGLDLLRTTIREGGKKLGGVMPPFKDKLSDNEIDLLIAYFQSKWSDDIYKKWAGRFEKTSLPSLDDIVEANNNLLTRHLRKRLGNVKPGKPEKTVIDDIWQVKLQNRYLYLVEGGKYAIVGDLINLENGQNLTDIARRDQAIDAISKYQEKDLIVFMPEGDVKTTLNIFTDTSCPYCRKLHKEVPQLTAAGIKVRYFPYPRGADKGPGYETLKSVWCAEDRNKAMTDAKNDVTENLPAGDCEAANIVDRGYGTGNQIGIAGTPALFKESGEKIEGYVPHQKLIDMLLK